MMSVDSSSVTTDLFGFVGAATTVIDVVTEHGFVHALTTAVAAHVVVRTLPPTAEFRVLITPVAAVVLSITEVTDRDALGAIRAPVVISFARKFLHFWSSRLCLRERLWQTCMSKHFLVSL